MQAQAGFQGRDPVDGVIETAGDAPVPDVVAAFEAKGLRGLQGACAPAEILDLKSALQYITSSPCRLRCRMVRE